MRYSPTLVDHFLNPRNAGMMREPDAVGEGEFEGCGDLARVFLRVRDGTVAEARFQAYGCGPTIAAASAVSELVVLRPVDDLEHLKSQEVERALDGLPDDRRHAADVVADAVRAAARAWLGRRG
ncbi:MAG: iron-sulfur cluster assembly scaffold protein [Candidatus Rokubacteria bacterium]|nr:iron-sulfur cluster assembly scaffold protein [Candidatus Rokubacteria bacterium]